MDDPSPLSQLVETYRFDDVVVLWARERLEHEIVVARALARAVVCEGLRIQAIDGRWAAPPHRAIEFHGYPYVGYIGRAGSQMSILRSSALNHLMAIVEKGRKPDLGKLHEEFIHRDDFRQWLLERNVALPRFWFAQQSAGHRFATPGTWNYAP